MSKRNEEKPLGNTVPETAPVKAGEDGGLSENAVPQMKQCVYIGPTIKGVVTKNTIYSNGIPRDVWEKTGKHPLFRNLFVPIDNLQEAARQMRTGGRYKVLYDKALKELNKEV